MREPILNWSIVCNSVFYKTQYNHISTTNRVVDDFVYEKVIFLHITTTYVKFISFKYFNNYIF